MGHRTLFLGYAVMFSELILAPVTPSNSARGAGIIYPIIRNLPPLYQSQPNDSSSRSIGSYIMDGDCCRLRDQRHFPDGDGSKFAVNWTDEKRISRHAKLGRLVPRDVAAQHFTGFAGSWLAYVLYPPVLKSGDQVPRWAETELQAMGPLCSREKRMLGLMVGALVLWILAVIISMPRWSVTAWWR